MVNISSRCLDQVIDCLIIHICRAFSCQFFSVLSLRICCHNTGTVKGIQRDNLNVFNLDAVSRSHRNTPVCRNSPFLPELYGFFRPDKRNRNFFSILICCHHTALDHVGCIFRTHVILMIMCCKHSIHTFDCKWIDYKWNGS